MTMSAPPTGALAPYRVLDLTGELGMLCTRLFAGLGADVIALEPPGGHPARRRGPFLSVGGAPRTSFYWLQQGAGKRSVTLAPETADGRALLLRLLTAADVLVESLPAGMLDQLGLGWDVLRTRNPRLVLTSISPYGQTGPRAHDPGSDLTGMAAGGLMLLCGDPDRPPLRVTVEQAYAQAGIQAAAATLVGLAHRDVTGAGAHVDVSVQAAVTGTLANNRLLWWADHITTHRAGGGRAFGSTPDRLIYRTVDGYVGYMRRSEHHTNLQRWLDDTGIELPFKVTPWQNRPLQGEGSAPPEQVAMLETALSQHFAARRKHDIQVEMQRYGMICAEVATPLDLVTSEHLTERGYYQDVHYPGLDQTLRVPGAPFKGTATPWRTSPAPLRPGQHNAAIYRDELGLSPAQLATLKGVGAI